MSDTPETDAVVAEMSEWTRPFISEKYDCITLESPIVAICRKLERERDEWRKAAFEITSEANKLKIRLKSELDEAIKLAQVFHADQADLLIKIEKLKIERDEALEKIKRQAERIRILEGPINHAGGLYK